MARSIFCDVAISPSRWRHQVKTLGSTMRQVGASARVRAVVLRSTILVSRPPGPILAEHSRELGQRGEAVDLRSKAAGWESWSA